LIREVIGATLVALGVAFSLIGSIGLLRLPDFFTRAHAATKPDTLGLVLVMFGIALLHGLSINSAKLILCAVFVSIANPAAAHALGRSAIRAGLQPWTKQGGGPQ